MYSCYILICQAQKLFLFLNQSVAPIFDSVAVLKLFNSALAVLVLDLLVQHDFSTLPCNADSVSLQLVDRQHFQSEVVRKSSYSLSVLPAYLVGPCLFGWDFSST